MTLALLAAALVMAGVGVWVSRQWRLVGQFLMLTAGLGLVAVIVLQLKSNAFSTQAPQSDRRLMAVGYTLANCVLSDVAGQSGSVALLFPQRQSMDEFTERSLQEGFLLPLRHTRGQLRLRAIRLERDKDNAVALKEALAQATEDLAIVCFCGAPPGMESLRAKDQSGGPLIYIFDSSGGTHWLTALKAGQIRAVAIPRPDLEAQSEKTSGGMPDQVFDRYFLLATEGNADEIASKVKKQK